LRYKSFSDLTRHLEGLYKTATGEQFPAQEANVEDVDHLRARAQVKWSQEQYDDAVDLIDRALLLSPAEARLWAEKSRYLHRGGMFAVAENSCNRAIEIDPNCVLAWVYKGMALLSLGRTAEALDCCSKALEIDPEHFQALNVKAFVLREDKKPEAAIECLEELLELVPVVSRPGILNNIAEAHIECGNYDEAMALLEQSLDVDPIQTYVWVNVGMIKSSMGRYEEALEQFNRAWAIEGPLKRINSFRIPWHIARTYDHLGNKEEALRYYTLYLQESPPFEQIEQKLRYMYFDAKKRISALNNDKES
jgi:tetratricopeptide (TPR) repeat protein